MAKPGPKPKEREELSNINNVNGKCPTETYGEKRNDCWEFTDLRTKLVDAYKSYGDSSLDRLIDYKLTKDGIHLDYCKSMRKNYSFRLMSDLYTVLWDIEMNNEIIDSADTLVSADLNLARCRDDIKKRNGNPPGINWGELKKENGKDCELNHFAKSVAIIGNFMPVPSKHQNLLRYMDERFDMVLALIKAFYYDKDHGISTNFMHESIEKWLMIYWENDGTTSWKKFVDSNYLKGSFVDENYDVVIYNGKLCQLSEIIDNRSIKMIEEYNKRIGLLGEKL